MKYAVINIETNVVENIIEASSNVIEGLEAGLGMRLVLSEGFAVEVLDTHDIITNKFMRDGVEVPHAGTRQEAIDYAIDVYTLELIEGGLL